MASWREKVAEHEGIKDDDKLMIAKEIADYGDQNDYVIER